MEIKRRPEDFVVYEVADVAPEGRGPFALYRLFKRGSTTWDVLGDIARRLRKRYEEIGYGGLKDRQALSYQFITIKYGPKKDLEGRNYRLEYLGQTSFPMSKARLKGNNFCIRVYEVAVDNLTAEIDLIRRFGVVNYFDEQRFGSIRQTKTFALKELILGHYEKALYLLLVGASQYEGRKTRSFRDCLRRHWPDVRPCVDMAPSRWEKGLLSFLSSHKPSKRTFKRAFALVDQEYLFLLGNAYQAYIWNETVKELLASLEDTRLFAAPYLLGELLFYKVLSEPNLKYLQDLKLPLPSPRLKISSPLRDFMETVLQREGISSLEGFRTLAKGAVFKTYPREIIVFPKDFSYEIRGQKEVLLKFFLPKGSYATVVLKRLFGLQSLDLGLKKNVVR